MLELCRATWCLHFPSLASSPLPSPQHPWPSLGPPTTSSRKCRPSCQSAPGSGCSPHRSRWPHRRGRGSYGPQPPASCPPGSPGVGDSGGKREAAMARPVLTWRPLTREGVGSLRVMLGSGGRINRQNHNPQPRVTQELLAPKVYSEEAS